MTKQSATNTAHPANSPPSAPRRGANLPTSVQDFITELASRQPPLRPAAIWAEAVKRFGSDEPDEDGNVAPRGLSQRTVEGMVQQTRDEIAKAPRPVWTLIDDDTGEPVIVLETLAEVISFTMGGVATFEVDEARMVARIGKAFPAMPALDRWSLAILYVVRRWREKRTDDIDIYLAFKPWENDEGGVERQYEYERAQRFGWVPEQPRPLFSDLHRVNLREVDVSADWIEAKQQMARAQVEWDRAMAQPGAQLKFPPVTADEYRRIFERWFGTADEPAEPDALQKAIDRWLPRRATTWKIGDDPKLLGEPVTAGAVSNPVSNDARSATVRRRPKRPRTSASQDMTDGDE